METYRISNSWAVKSKRKYEMMENNSLDKKESGTAMATAFLRALAAHDSRKEIRGNDSLAEIFLSEEQRRPLKDLAARTWVMQNRITPGAYEFMIARTAFFDQIVEQALRRNIDQIVFLGAGYDSRPYRFEKFIQDTIIFELDTEPTQQRKKYCLQQAQIPVSEQIKFISVNFDTDDLVEKLLEGGFSREKRTLFIWEGVTYYLRAEVVDNILSVIKENTIQDSSICFDYAALSDEALNEIGAREMRKLLRTQYSSESTKFGVRVGKINSFLAEKGFKIIEHLTATEMNIKYLGNASHSNIGKIPSLFCSCKGGVKTQNRPTKCADTGDSAAISGSFHALSFFWLAGFAEFVKGFITA